MIITTILGNTHDDPVALGKRHVETVTLPSADLVKRIQRLTTDHGNEIGLRLPAGSADLRDGDILVLTADNAVVVRVATTDVIVITPDSITQMGQVAHNLGNRHLPAQFFTAESDYGQEVMVVQYDHTVADFLDHHQVAYSRQERVLPVPFRHAEHTH